jgi:lipopolysaccharide export LptBFGC system permease protein LptF
LSNEYNLQVSSEFLNYQQGRAIFYGMDKESNKEKYVFFYLQRKNSKSSVYEVYAEEGVNKEEAGYIIENNHVEYQTLNLSIICFYLGDRDNDIREFLYWHTDAQLIDSTQKPIFIKFTTGEVFRDEKLLVR